MMYLRSKRKQKNKMLIQEIKPVGSKKGKYKVCLEDGTDFVLYKKEVAQFSLEIGMELTPELYERILREVCIPRAKRRAMHLLEKMDRTEEQLISKLKENGYPPEAVEEAITYVKSYHYIDDERYASNYVRFHQGQKSRQRIKMDLLQKGISKDLVELALENEFAASEEDMIRVLLEKKHYDPETADRKEREKMFRFLLQRGFHSSDIQRALGRDLW